jgi:hypothetical protein
MEEAFEGPRRTRRALSERRTRDTSLSLKETREANPFAVLNPGPLNAGEEDEDSEYDPGNEGRAMVVTPKAPKAKRTLAPPQTPTQTKATQMGPKVTQKGKSGKTDENGSIEAIIQAIHTFKEETIRTFKEETAKAHAAASAVLNEQVASLTEQVVALKEQVATLSALVLQSGSDGPATGSNPGSGPAWTNPTPWSNPSANSQDWPPLSASQSKSQDKGLSPRASQADVQEMANRERMVVITLGRSVEVVQGKSIAELKEFAEKELQREDSTKDVQVIGVSAVTKGRLETMVASKEQAQQARANARWVRGFGEAAKAKEATWYPIKVDGVAREAICKEGGNGWEFREDALQVIDDSNSRSGMKVKAMKLHWLSKPSDNPSGSLVVYLDSWSVAQQMVAEGIFIIGANAATPARFIQQELPLRCYNCNKYGHTQIKCQASPKCGKCAAQHRTSNCTGIHPDKCAACQGAHRVTDPRCPLFIKERLRLEEQRKRGTFFRPRW